MSKTNWQQGDVVDVRPLGDDFPGAKHTPLLETDQIKLKRMVLPKGKQLPEHNAPSTITVHCIEGHIRFSLSGKTVDLTPGLLVYLEAGEPHSLEAVEDSSFLLTIFHGNKS